MAPPDHRPARPPRLTGSTGLLRALHNLGLVGGAPGPGHARGQFIASDAQPIRLQSSGAGTPVLLLHGLGCTHRHWQPVARRLARRHQVHAWDARGHGSSVALPDTRITLARLAQDLHELLDHLELPRAALVGHSMGALTVMQYLQTYGSARVSAVTLIDQSPRIVTDADWRLGLFGGCSAAMLRQLIAGARSDLAETVLHEVEAGAAHWLAMQLGADAPLGRLLRGWLRRFDVSPLLDLAESLIAADFRATLTRLDAPLLVVLGKRSPHYGGLPLDAWYRQAVPHADVRVYERAAHSPHCSEPGHLADELLGFMAAHA